MTLHHPSPPPLPSSSMPSSGRVFPPSPQDAFPPPRLPPFSPLLSPLPLPSPGHFAFVSPRAWFWVADLRNPSTVVHLVMSLRS